MTRVDQINLCAHTDARLITAPADPSADVGLALASGPASVTTSLTTEEAAWWAAQVNGERTSATGSDCEWLVDGRAGVLRLGRTVIRLPLGVWRALAQRMDEVAAWPETWN